MAQIASFRGALWDRSKVDLTSVAAAPLANIRDRLERGELVRDSSRALYRYHQTVQRDGRAVTRKTTICAVRLEPFREGTIRPHEATDPGARDKAIAGITAERAHTAPVFAGYRDAAGEVDRLFRRTEDAKPTFDVTTPDGTQHRLWSVGNAEITGKLRTVFAPKKLHVLDGHARYEGMLEFRDQVGAPSMYSSVNYGLACLVNVEEPGLVVAPRHRIVRSAGLSRDAVLAAAKPYFVIEKLDGAAKDVAKLDVALADTLAHQPAFVALFTGDADAWKLTLSPDVTPTALGIAVHRALQKYDPIVFEQVFVSRAAPGAKLETALDPAAVVRAVGAGAELGAILRPLAIDQVLHADELGQLLPFGSTAFVPTLASLVGYLVDPDDDLI
jgi:uncharacterized protein (DUF1015 family)